MKLHNAENERIKRRYFAYLKEAKRHSEPTVDAVAKALSRFEADTRCRDFKVFHFKQRLQKAPYGRPILILQTLAPFAPLRESQFFPMSLIQGRRQKFQIYLARI